MEKSVIPLNFSFKVHQISFRDTLILQFFKIMNRAKIKSCENK